MKSIIISLIVICVFTSSLHSITSQDTSVQASFNDYFKTELKGNCENVRAQCQGLNDSLLQAIQNNRVLKDSTCVSKGKSEADMTLLKEGINIELDAIRAKFSEKNEKVVASVGLYNVLDKKISSEVVDMTSEEANLTAQLAKASLEKTTKLISACMLDDNEEINRNVESFNNFEDSLKVKIGDITSQIKEKTEEVDADASEMTNEAIQTINTEPKHQSTDINDEQVAKRKEEQEKDSIAKKEEANNRKPILESFKFSFELKSCLKQRVNTLLKSCSHIETEKTYCLNEDLKTKIQLQITNFEEVLKKFNEKDIEAACTAFVNNKESEGQTDSTTAKENQKKIDLGKYEEVKVEQERKQEEQRVIQERKLIPDADLVIAKQEKEKTEEVFKTLPAGGFDMAASILRHQSVEEVKKEVVKPDFVRKSQVFIAEKTQLITVKKDTSAVIETLEFNKDVKLQNTVETNNKPSVENNLRGQINTTVTTTPDVKNDIDTAANAELRQKLQLDDVSKFSQQKIEDAKKVAEEKQKEIIKNNNQEETIVNEALERKKAALIAEEKANILKQQKLDEEEARKKAIAQKIVEDEKKRIAELEENRKKEEQQKKIREAEEEEKKIQEAEEKKIREAAAAAAAEILRQKQLKEEENKNQEQDNNTAPNDDQTKPPVDEKDNTPNDDQTKPPIDDNTNVPNLDKKVIGFKSELDSINQDSNKIKAYINYLQSKLSSDLLNNFNSAQAYIKELSPNFKKQLTIPDNKEANFISQLLVSFENLDDNMSQSSPSDYYKFLIEAEIRKVVDNDKDTIKVRQSLILVLEQINLEKDKNSVDSMYANMNIQTTLKSDIIIKTEIIKDFSKDLALIPSFTNNPDEENINPNEENIENDNNNNNTNSNEVPVESLEIEPAVSYLRNKLQQLQQLPQNENTDYVNAQIQLIETDMNKPSRDNKIQYLESKIKLLNSELDELNENYATKEKEILYLISIVNITDPSRRLQETNNNTAKSTIENEDEDCPLEKMYPNTVVKEFTLFTNGLLDLSSNEKLKFISDSTYTFICKKNKNKILFRKGIMRRLMNNDTYKKEFTEHFARLSSNEACKENYVKQYNLKSTTSTLTDKQEDPLTFKNQDKFAFFEVYRFCLANKNGLFIRFKKTEKNSREILLLGNHKVAELSKKTDCACLAPENNQDTTKYNCADYQIPKDGLRKQLQNMCKKINERKSNVETKDVETNPCDNADNDTRKIECANSLLFKIESPLSNPSKVVEVSITTNEETARRMLANAEVIYPDEIGVNDTNITIANSTPTKVATTSDALQYIVVEEVIAEQKEANQEILAQNIAKETGVSVEEVRNNLNNTNEDNNTNSNFALSANLNVKVSNSNNSSYVSIATGMILLLITIML